MKKKMVIVDGNSLLFRAYYATAYGDPSAIMRTSYGVPTNAIFAFSNMFSKILKDLKKGDCLFVGFDADGHTFRKEQYENYKANRKPAPEDLIPQFKIAREFLDALNIKWYEKHGVEADDICGTVSKLASKEDYDVIIFTSDHDYLQLIDKNIKVSLLKVGLSNMELFDEAYLFEKMGLTPEKIIDFKGLVGDSSDNYPGVKGIGEKTALKLINEYGSLPNILASAPNMKGKIGQKILDEKENAEMSYDLARIRLDVDLPFTLSDCAYEGYRFEEANSFAKKYELRQLVNRLPTSLKKEEDGSEFEFKECQKLPDSFFLSDHIGLALDTSYLEYHDVLPIGLALSNGKETVYLSFDSLKNDRNAISLLENENIEKVVYDLKASLYSLDKMGIKLNGVKDDILLSAYLLDSGTLSLPSDVYRSLGIDIDGKDDLLLFDDKNKEKTAKMAYFALSSIDRIRNSLKENEALNLYESIEMPLSEVLAKTEKEGFPLDKKILREIGKGFIEKRDSLEKEICLLANEKFNPNSPKQVAYILYEKLGLKGNKGHGTSVNELNALKDEHPIVSKVLEYRKYAKLVGTYIDGLSAHIKEDKKIHSYFNQAETSTGRLSSSSPNLQNISARDEESKSIRKAFHYEGDSLNLISFDYSQIELRVLADMSNSSSYQELFLEGKDIHSETAKKIFNVNEVTNEMRRKAKAVNFAIIYGSTVYGLSEQIGTSVSEAGRIIASFYRNYPEIGEYLNSIVKTAERQGYVTTKFGRRRYFRDINDPNFAKREAAKRAALNAPIQGSAADLIKIAMIKADDFLTKNKLKSKMVLQIHDELIFAVPDEELDVIKKEIKNIMENAMPLSVPLKVNIGIGKNFYDLKD